MHNSKPTVSVIIPAYNSEKYIGEAIESVLAQTYSVFEIIVVDDGSTDNTAKIVQECIRAQEHKSTRAQVRYIYQENRGPAAARNNGIRAAKGDYLAFLDSDDIWLPEKIILQIKKNEENSEYCLVHTDRIRIGVDNIAEPVKIRDIPEGSVFNNLLMENFICTSTVLIKKSCFDETGLFDENMGISEDYDMWLRVANRYKTGFINQPLIKYRISSSGYSRSNIEVSYSRERAAFLKALEFYQGDKERLKKDRLHNIFYQMGNSLFYIRDYSQSLSAFSEAYKLRKMDISAIGKGLLSRLLINLGRGL